MNNEIELLQNWLARHRQTEMNYDCNPTQYECQIFDAIEHIIAENAQYSEHNMKLEQALIDTDRLMQEYLSKCLDLEHRLANCIEPKFKSRDTVFRINQLDEIERVVIVNTHINIICETEISYTIAILSGNKTIEDMEQHFRKMLEDFDLYFSQEREEDLFTTEDEAKKKLEELKNGKDICDC